ncbi:MAG: hypothetical protein Ta2A_06300 [Treponemataceae bacterium]|nr:MAG: hypothetical protein Ta2A_06300 [Treponemataceae bacterium]
MDAAAALKSCAVFAEIGVMGQARWEKLHGLYRKKGFFKKNNFSWWRFIFTGFHAATGEAKTFFIEYGIINPYLMPKTADKKITENVHRKISLLDSASMQIVNSDAHILMRAGSYEKNGKNIEKIFPVGNFSVLKDNIYISFAECILGGNKIAGSILQSRHKKTGNAASPNISLPPSQTGSINWNLQSVEERCYPMKINLQKTTWTSFIKKPQLTGSINFDGDEYDVLGETAVSYIDFIRASVFPEKWFNLASASLQSVISAKQLQNTFFSVRGIFNKSTIINAVIEGKKYDFSFRNPFLKYTHSENYTETENVLHWSCSTQSGIFLLDIDVFCPREEMHSKTYKIPQTGKEEKKVLSILSGATGKGELKLYKKSGKTLEQIEIANLDHVICEYGGIE